MKHHSSLGMLAIICSLVLFSCSSKQESETTDNLEISETVAPIATEDDPLISSEKPEPDKPSVPANSETVAAPSVGVPAPNHPPQRDNVPQPPPKDNPILLSGNSEDGMQGVPTPPSAPIPTKAKTDGPINNPEVMPLYGGCNGNNTNANNQCSQMAVIKHLASHIRYPEIAKENDIQGTVIVEFVVGKTGKLSNVRLLKDIGGGCGQEAMRVIKSMPNWTPGTQDGKAMAVIMRQPVKFRLQ